MFLNYFQDLRIIVRPAYGGFSFYLDFSCTQDICGQSIAQFASVRESDIITTSRP